ncbi:MAG: glycoside hydrolase family 36 [Parabacteroides sp.]|nr:glycoside hydrolase family 36 [Parabacteroides sp.]
MKKVYLLYLFTAIFCLQPAGSRAQNEFAYQKGKTFQSVGSYPMPDELRPDVQNAGILYEESIPATRTTVSYTVKLPEYIHGLFFSRDTRPGDYAWPNNTNRLLPWSFGHISEITRDDYPGIPSNAKPSPLGDALLLELPNGQYLFLKALSGENTLSWFQVNTAGELDLLLSTLSPDYLPVKAPLLLSGSGNTVYEALRQAYSRLIADTGTASLKKRQEKDFFEAFRYLGWCTWEHYHADIDETKLLKDMEAIASSGIPVRYVLVDDGHLAHSARQLTGFVPDKRRFPNGWEKILARRTATGITWFGIWYVLSGYWEGIAKENTFPEAVRETLYPANGCLLPGPDSCSIERFYQSYVRTLKSYGFDFLKIDNQSYTLPLYMGSSEAVRRARICNEALERSTRAERVGLINCMAQNVLNTDHTTYSPVTRVSIDYKKYDRDMAKSHLFQSFANTLWAGQTVWPDQDMFHSSDTVCGSLMARSKALSGGPVYLSDAPADFVEENVFPLIDETGKIFRPSAPGVPTPESVFRNPLHDGEVYRVFAPTGDEAVSLICYNLNVSARNQDVTATVRAADYLLRNAFEGGEPAPAGRLLLYDWHTRTAEELSGVKQVRLSGFDDRLFHLCPIRNGWAVIGIQEKYLSPATVQILSRTDRQLRLRVLTRGTLRIWADEGNKKELRSISVEKPGIIITVNK